MMNISTERLERDLREMREFLEILRVQVNRGCEALREQLEATETAVKCMELVHTARCITVHCTDCPRRGDDLDGTVCEFYWSEVDIPLREILELTPHSPLFGHRSGKNMNTHWLCFMKLKGA